MFAIHLPQKRSLGVMALAGLVLVAILSLLWAPAAHAYETEEVAFLHLINDYRQQRGIAPLEINQKLSNASADYSQLMGDLGCWSHTCGGTTFVERIRAAGYGYNTALAENLAYGQTTAADVFYDWQHSPGHDVHMLDSAYCAIGIGFVYVPNSPGLYYWTTDFGGVCEGDPQPELDVYPPSVSVSGLTGSDLVSGMVFFTAQASDDVGVTKVEFYIDDVLVHTDTAADYYYVWDTIQYSPGSHALKVIAYDGTGKTAQDTRTVTVDNFTVQKKYLFTWYDQSNSNWQDWVLMANPSSGAAPARTSVKVTGYTFADRNIGVGAPSETPQFPGMIGGPVTVGSTQPLISTQRVLYKESFNEIAALPSEALESTYYFTWYDSLGMSTWILIGNEGQQAANVDVYIAGQLMGNYVIQPGAQVTPQYAGERDGPVKVTCTNGQPLIVSQRSIYMNSFSEVWGMPESRIGSEFNFTWYDFKQENSMVGNWILIGNMDTTSATVDVYIADRFKGEYQIAPGDRVMPQYEEEMDGPVRVVSDNTKIIVSQRILYKDSFEEFQGLTGQNFSTNFYYPWYDSRLSNGMIGNWILAANMGLKPAEVEIYIGAELKGSYTIPEGGRITPMYENTMAGPVHIVCTNGVPLMTTQRVIYKNSFNEISGINW